MRSYFFLLRVSPRLLNACRSVVVSVFILLWLMPKSALALNFTKIVDSFDQVPGQSPGTTFYIQAWSTPALQGNKVVFTASWPGIFDSLWSAKTDDSVPGGNGTFQNSQVNFSLSQYAVSGKYVVFRGSDVDSRDGVYFVSTTGGPITKIVAVGDVLPDGRTVVGNGVRFHHAPIQIDSLSGEKVALRLDFFDPVLSNSGTGIYVATLP